MTEPNEKVGTYSVTGSAEIVRKRAEKKYPSVFAKLRAEKEEAVQKERDKVQAAYVECKEIVEERRLRYLNMKTEPEDDEYFTGLNDTCHAIEKDIQKAAEKLPTRRGRVMPRKIEKPDWWPENPYPEDIFPMTRKDFCKFVPDPQQRTALSGCMGRLFWEIASDTIYDAFLSKEEK